MKLSFYSRFGPAILLITVFFLPLIFMGAARALKSNKNDVSQWLPAHYEQTKTFNKFKELFGGEEFVLVSWDGCTLDDDRLTLFARKLSPETHEGEGDWPFADVLTGPDALAEMTTEPVNLTLEQALERLKGSLIGPDLQTTCVVLTLSEAGKKDLKRTIALIESTAIEECNIPPDDLHMGGPPVDNVSIDRAGEQSLYRLAGLAAGLGLIISWWCLRSLKLVALVFSAGILSAATSLAIVYYSGSAMNAILLTMPSLVYVAAISGAIHISNYYRDTVIEQGVEGAPERAIRHAALPISLATGTTAFGLGSLAYSDLIPIQLFGIYSAVGVAVSVVFLMLYLPATFQMWPDQHVADSTEEEKKKLLFADPMTSPKWRYVGEGIINHWGVVLVGCVLFMAVCGWGLKYHTTSIQMMKLFDPKARIIQDYAWLEEHLGELIPMEILISVPKDSEELNFLERIELVKRVQDRVDDLPNVGSSLSAATFMPEIKQRKSYPRLAGLIPDPNRMQRRVRNEKLLDHREEFLKGDYLREVEDRELWRISVRVAALRDVDYGEFIHTLESAVDPIIEEEIAGGASDIEVTYTGLVPLVYKAQRTLLNGLIEGFAYDLALITVVMMIAVRSFSAGLILILPSIFPVVVVFGLMSWWGIAIDIGTVMTPAVALGVTVDDVVHFMLKYRRAVEKGKTRSEAVMAAYRGCARAMYQSWGVIGLGLSVFAFSPFTPTQRFGFMMVALLTAALPGNLLLLPALLISPFGKYFGRPPKDGEKPGLETLVDIDEEDEPAAVPSTHARKQKEPAHTSTHYGRAAS